jgi:hypothetical protein
VDNLQLIDLARVTLPHPDVINAHKKVISSHVTVTLAHFKPVFSLENWPFKVLNCIKGLKRRLFGTKKTVDDFFSKFIQTRSKEPLASHAAKEYSCNF